MTSSRWCLRIFVNAVDKCFQMVRTHIGIHTVTEIGDPSFGAKPFHHLFCERINLLLQATERERKLQFYHLLSVDIHCVQNASLRHPVKYESIKAFYDINNVQNDINETSIKYKRHP